MKRSIALALGLALALGAQARAATGTSSQKHEAATGVELPASEADFLDQLHQGNEEEVRLGELAQRKGASAEVRSYGKMLAQDHRQLDQKLQRLAGQKGIRLGQFRPSSQAGQKLDEAKKADMEALQTLSGTMFDHQFLAGMVADHDHDIPTVEAALQRWPDAKPLLEGALPVLQKHRERAYKELGQLKFKGS